jgi:hypothetical protein
MLSNFPHIGVGPMIAISLDKQMRPLIHTPVKLAAFDFNNQCAVWT